MFVVAGVTGNVGSVVASELLAAGEKVRALVRDPAKAERWKSAGAELAVASLDDAGALTDALRGAEGFFTLLPPNYPATGIMGYMRRIAEATAKAVKESRVPHVVLLSSVGGDLAEGTGPIKGLHLLENVLRETGTKLTSIRASYFQENVKSSLVPAKGAGIFPNMTPSADYPFPMIATRDIGVLAAHELRMPTPKSEVIDLVGPSYSMRQVAELLGKKLGKSLKIVDIPPAGQVDAFKQAGMSPEIAELFAEMNAGFASGRIKPVGDRVKLGRTPLESVIATLS